MDIASAEIDGAALFDQFRQQHEEQGAVYVHADGRVGLVCYGGYVRGDLDQPNLI